MLSMYKPGQGYWTRMMSAIFFGVFVAGGALWLSNQIGTMRVPTDSWNYTVSSTEGFTPAREVKLVHNGDEVGSAFVRSTEGSTLVLENLTMRSGLAANASEIQISAEGVTPVEAESLVTVPKFERTYLQGGVAAGVLLIGAIVVLWFCYSNRKFGDFLIATEGEMKKVNWSSRREVFGSTWVVIAISVMIATLLFVTDIIFKSIAEGINLIQS